MTISDDRNNRMEDLRKEYMRVGQRANNEIRIRQLRGLTRFQALTGLLAEILGGNLNAISSPPPPGSSIARRPSVSAIRQVINGLYASRARIAATSTYSAPTLSSTANILNFGNAVRNLEPELSAPRPPNQRTVTAENRTSLRTLSPNLLQNLRQLVNSRNRNANQRERTQAPRKSANKRERTPTPSRNANERERTPPPSGIVRDLERTPPPKRVVNDPERTPPLRPPPRRNANDSERTPPPRRPANGPENAPRPDLPLPYNPNIPAYQCNSHTFNPSDLTLMQALTVISYFNIDDDNEYELIRNSLLHFSIKIYGLEKCAKKDFRLEVCRFIQRYFNLDPDIELCVRPVPDHRSENVVGVLFYRCETANLILARRNVLRDTRYRVSQNDMFNWIIFGYEPKW